MVDPRVDHRTPPLYSTWRGLELKPKAGKCDLLLEHIQKYTCAGNESHYIFLMSWHAQILQQPETKLNTAVAILGPKGIGKTTLGEVMLAIIGEYHSTKVSQGDHVTGKFNEHLRDLLFLLVEEAVWGGNKSAEAALEDLISAYQVTIEKKFGSIKHFRSMIRLMIISDEKFVVPAGKNERRYFVLEALDPCPGLASDDPERAKYFKPLHDELENGGYEAFMDILMKWDFRQVNLRYPPVTDGLRRQMAYGFSSEVHWLLDAMNDGGFTDAEGERLGDNWLEDRPLEISTANLINSFRAHVKTYNGAPAASDRMVKFLKEHGNATKKRLTGLITGRSWGYVLDPLKDWKDRFAKEYRYEFEEVVDDKTDDTGPDGGGGDGGAADGSSNVSSLEQARKKKSA